MTKPLNPWKNSTVILILVVFKPYYAIIYLTQKRQSDSKIGFVNCLTANLN